MHQYSLSNIPTVLTTIFVWFLSSDFKCLWLVAGNRYLQCDGVGEFGVLDEDGGLTVGNKSFKKGEHVG